MNYIAKFLNEMKPLTVTRNFLFTKRKADKNELDDKEKRLWHGCHCHNK